MKALVIEGGFGLDRLQLVERQQPTPGRGELLLAMRAASLNYRDLMTVSGTYNPAQPLPLVPCSDGVGVVLEVGDGVRGFAPGGRVCPIFAQRWLDGEPTRERLRSTLGGPLDGVLAERMVVPAESVVVPPEHLTDVEAATLPCAAVTAWTALVTEGQLRAGDTVLVEGSGGVSLFALQLALLQGARVFAVTSSEEKRQRLLALGASEVLSYREQPQWGRAVSKLTGGRGVDHVVDIGGAETIEQALRAVRIGGRVSVIGALSGAGGPPSVLPILMRYVRLQGILVGHRRSFGQLSRAVSAHRLRPVVDSVHDGLEAVAGALGRMQRAEHVGKICVRISDDATAPAGAGGSEELR